MSFMAPDANDLFENCYFQELSLIYLQLQSPGIFIPTSTGSYSRLHQPLPYISGMAEQVSKLFLQVPFRSFIPGTQNSWTPLCTTNHPLATSCTPAAPSAPSKAPGKIPTHFNSPVLVPPSLTEVNFFSPSINRNQQVKKVLSNVALRLWNLLPCENGTIKSFV